MLDRVDMAWARTQDDWGSPRGGSTPGTRSSPRAELVTLPRGNPLFERLLRLTPSGSKHCLRCGAIVCASLPHSYPPNPGPALTTFVSRSSAGSQSRSRGPQQSRQTSARQR